MCSPVPASHRQADLARSRFAAVLLAIPILVGPWIRIEGKGASLFGVEGPACVAGRWMGQTAGCPGCGLTRSTALTLQGDVPGALAFHWAGPLLVAACLGGLAVHLDILLRTRGRTRVQNRLLAWGARGFWTALLLAWSSRLFLA